MEYLLRTLAFLQLMLERMTRPLCAVLEWWSDRDGWARVPPVPPEDGALLVLGAVQLAEAIRRRQVRSERAVAAYVARIRAVDPMLNAVVDERFEAALSEARATDQLLDAANAEELERLTRDKPLLGVPVTIKESCSVEGMSLCVGCLERAGERAVRDGEAVGLLRGAGAIVMCATNTPELCLSWDTSNLATGRCASPHGRWRSAGGSSGGEAALLGAGASPLGLGSDIAGSIRIPAMFCGAWGHKATGGAVSITGHVPSSADELFAHYLTLGPMTRRAEDLRAVLRILAPEAPLRLDVPVDVSSLTVTCIEEAAPRSSTLLAVDAAIKRSMGRAVAHLRSVGCALSDVTFPQLADSLEISICMFFSTLADIPDILRDATKPKQRRNLYLELGKNILGLSTNSLNALLFTLLKETRVFIPDSRTSHYVREFEALKTRLEEHLGKDGVLLYPTFPTAAFPRWGIMTHTTGVMYTMLFNLMGFPATHVPAGRDANGLPVGFQVIAAVGHDRLCLSIAEELQRAGIAAWTPPPHLAAQLLS